MRRISFVALLALLMSLSGCTGVPDGVEPVRGFELDRYLGTWYEIARLDHRFERGLQDVSATYTPRDDGGIEVRNRGFDPERGEWKEAIGRAYPIGDPGVASLKVSFFGPFFGSLHVFALDEVGYSEAVVSGPDRSYLWILARTKSLPDERVRALEAAARDVGFDTDALIWVQHARTDPVLAR